MKVAVMQPYFFPYLGYFQLINSVDKFVFYDDVSFIKKGWINRNRILTNNQDKLLTLPCIKASQNKMINEIKIDLSSKEYSKIKKTISESYKKAPFYFEVMPLIENLFYSNIDNISDFAIKSILLVSNYLEIETKFLKSSESFESSKGMDRADRLIYICKQTGSNKYNNSYGGKALYSKDYFNSNQINLSFINGNLPPYKQFNNHFHEGLSIIDGLMFNSKDELKKMLLDYKLE
jgi:hypothetical protein